MEKPDITISQILSLIGPNTLVRIIDDTIRTPEAYSEDEVITEKTVKYGTAAKIRKDLDPDDAGRLVKHLSPIDEADGSGRHIFRIYTY